MMRHYISLTVLLSAYTFDSLAADEFNYVTISQQGSDGIADFGVLLDPSRGQSLTPGGQIMFFANVDEDGTSRSSVWTANEDPAIPLTRVIQAGDPAPVSDIQENIPSAVSARFGGIHPFGVFEDGEVLFHASRGWENAEGASFTYTSHDEFFWQKGLATSTQLYADVSFDENIDLTLPRTVNVPAYSPNGFAAIVTRSPDQVTTLYAENLVVRSNDPLPGGTTQRFPDSLELTLNRNYGFRTEGGMYFRNGTEGIYLANNDLTDVILQGDRVEVALGIGPLAPDPLAGAIAKIDATVPIQVGADNGLAFAGEIQYDAVTGTSPGIILVSGSDSELTIRQPVALDGQFQVVIDDPAERRPVLFGPLKDFLLGRDGKIYFEATAEIREVGLLGQDRNYIWEYVEGKPLRALIGESDTLTDGFKFTDDFSLIDVNAGGDLLFSAKLDRAAAEINSGNDDGLYLYKPQNDVGKQLLVVAREGDPIDLNDPQRFGFPGARRGFALSDDGNVLFSSGSESIILATMQSVLLGDCNANGQLDTEDLKCLKTLGERDAVLGALNLLEGDFDGNGDVEFSDFLTLSANFGKVGSYQDGDVDLSGGVGFPDFLALSANFGRKSEKASTVPEAHSLTMIIMGLMGLSTLRRRVRTAVRSMRAPSGVSTKSKRK